MLNLTEKAPLVAKLRASGELLVEACAAVDREPFRAALARLGEPDALESELMRRTKPADMPRLAAPTPGLRRLSLLEQRLRRDRLAKGASAERARRRVASQALALAAIEARSAAELVDHLKRLRAVGVPSGAGQVFRSLGQELADWALTGAAVAEVAKAPPSSEVQAMQQIIVLAEDPAEMGARFRHLVTAATQLFNEGKLGRSVRMLQLAGRLAAEKTVQASFADPVIRKGHEALDPQRLRAYMEKPERHAQLQALMSFFDAGLGVETLLQQLETEERRDRRRMILDLLVVHGERARAVVRARLVASVDKPASDFSRRNWVYLLRVVPRPGSTSGRSRRSTRSPASPRPATRRSSSRSRCSASRRRATRARRRRSPPSSRRGRPRPSTPPRARRRASRHTRRSTRSRPRSPVKARPPRGTSSSTTGCRGGPSSATPSPGSASSGARTCRGRPTWWTPSARTCATACPAVSSAVSWAAPPWTSRPWSPHSAARARRR